MNITASETLSYKPSAEVQAAVMQLWNVLRETRQNLRNLEEEKIQLAQKNEKLEEQLQQHAVAAAKLQTYIEHLQHEARQHGIKTDALKEQIAFAQTLAANHEQTIITLQTELGNQQTTLRTQESELEQITHQKVEIESLYALLEEKESELTALREALNLAKEQTTTIELQLAEQKTKNSRAEQLQQDLEIVQAELVRRNTEIHQRYNEIIEYKDRATELESQVLKAEQTIAALTAEAQEAAELRQALQILQNQHDALLQFEDEETEETMVLQEQVVELNQQLDEQSALLHLKEEQIEELTARIQEDLTANEPNRLSLLTLAEKEQLTLHIQRLADKVQTALTNISST